MEELGGELLFLIIKLGFRHVVSSQHTATVCADGKNIHVSVPFSQSVLWLLHSLKMSPVNALFIIGSTLGKAVLIWQLTCWGAVLKEIRGWYHQ